MCKIDLKSMLFFYFMLYLSVLVYRECGDYLKVVGLKKLVW